MPFYSFISIDAFRSNRHIVVNIINARTFVYSIPLFAFGEKNNLLLNFVETISGALDMQRAICNDTCTLNLHGCYPFTCSIIIILSNSRQMDKWWWTQSKQFISNKLRNIHFGWVELMNCGQVCLHFKCNMW